MSRLITSAKACLFVITLLLACLSHAQTCSIPGQAGNTSLTTQPNTFFPATTSAVAGATAITVGAGTGVNSGIQAGDLLLLIQMQGADIDTTDDNRYGDGTVNAGVTATVAFGVAGYAGGVNGNNFVAGNYEWAVATGGGASFGAGGTINLSVPLTNSYFTRNNSTTAGRQSWQVVRVPQYSGVTIGNGFAVQAWNGSSGGLLVLDAASDINLNGQVINGSGLGFRAAGAVIVNPNTTCTTNYNTSGCPQYVQTIAAALGASKGEGISGTPARIYTGDPAGAGTGAVTAGTVDGYPAGEAARGAPANAGGGGNQHNAGGGGGGNGGAGGNGGNSWNSSVKTFVGLRLGGFGGSPIASTASRWLLGGAGGAGDVGGNAATSPDGSGGAAGAMVIMRASRIISGGATINVNGAAGIQARATDAAGGGGSGGTVILAAGTGGLSGALTVNAAGGTGGTYQVVNDEQDGAGGGGGGGILITNLSGVTFNAPGGAAGGSRSNSCPPTTAGANCGQLAGSAASGSTGYAIVSPGVQVGYECLPQLNVSKVTTTPLVTASTGATANYVVTVTNNGGGARFVNVTDALPPNWTIASSTGPVYLPVQPLSAGRLSSGAETIAITPSSIWSVGAAPLTGATNGSNTVFISSFALAPIARGVPSSVSFTFVASIPDQATVGSYQNAAGIAFLDPTRAAASTRTISPLSAVTANRTGTAYAPTTYNSYAGVGTTNVGGSNYDGLPTGSTAEDVRLIPDFSVIKTAPTSATPGTTFTYTLTPRNNGRPVGSLTFSATQASDVTTANVPDVLGSNPVTLTDTLPAGVTLTNAFSGAGWSCTGSGTSTIVCTLANANAYPAAAATNFPILTATALITAGCSPPPVPAARTNTVVISSPQAESVTSNNTATAVTAISCASANVSVVKTDGVTTLAAGSTTTYVITVSNAGPGAANGSVLSDTPSAGLSCNAISCGAATGGAICPASGASPGELSIANLISPGSGVNLMTLPSGSSLKISVTCAVTASGL